MCACVYTCVFREREMEGETETEMRTEKESIYV